jgi:hypothetical protein
MRLSKTEFEAIWAGALGGAFVGAWLFVSVVIGGMK